MAIHQRRPAATRRVKRNTEEHSEGQGERTHLRGGRRERAASVKSNAPRRTHTAYLLHLTPPPPARIVSEVRQNAKVRLEEKTQRKKEKWAMEGDASPSCGPSTKYKAGSGGRMLSRRIAARSSASRLPDSVFSASAFVKWGWVDDAYVLRVVSALSDTSTAMRGVGP